MYRTRTLSIDVSPFDCVPAASGSGLIIPINRSITIRQVICLFLLLVVLVAVDDHPLVDQVTGQRSSTVSPFSKNARSQPRIRGQPRKLLLTSGWCASPLC